MPGAIRSGGAVVGGGSRQGQLSEQRTRDSRGVGPSTARALLSSKIITPLPAAVTGTGASAFGFSTAATGVEIFTGSAASTFLFSSSSSGQEVFTGAGGSAWIMAESSAGLEIFSGPAASTFTWSSASSGAEIFIGQAASTFGFSSLAVGLVVNPPLVGVAASTFTFSSSGSGDTPIIEIEAAPDRTFRIRADPTLPKVKIWIHGASSFGWGSAARAIVIPPIYGASASSFASAIAAEGDVDVTDLLIHLEDERLLMGIGELELV